MKKTLWFAVMTLFAAALALGQSVRVTSPNGGERWELGDRETITWTHADVNGNVRINLLNAAGRRVGNIDNVPVTDGRCTWTVGQLDSGTAEAGEYIVELYVRNEDVEDRSDAFFSIIGEEEPPAPGGRPSRDLELKKFWYTADDGGWIVAKVRNSGKPIDANVDFHVMFPSGGPGDRIVPKRLTLGNNEETDLRLYELPPRRFPLMGVKTRVTVDGPDSRVNESNEKNNTLQATLGIVDVSVSLPRSEMEIIDHGNWFVLRYTIRVRHNLDRVLPDIQLVHQIYHINGTQLLYTFNIHNLGPGVEYHKTFENVFFVRDHEIFRVDEPCSLKKGVVYYVHAAANSWRWRPYEMYLDIQDDNNWAGLPFTVPD